MRKFFTHLPIEEAEYCSNQETLHVRQYKIGNPLRSNSCWNP